MQPMSPVIPGENFDEVIIAKHQAEYENLPAIGVYPGITISRWRLSLWERVKVLFIGNVYLWVWNFGKPLSPVILEIEKPRLHHSQTGR